EQASPSLGMKAGGGTPPLRAKKIGRIPKAGNAPLHVLAARRDEHRAENVEVDPELVEQDGGIAGGGHPECVARSVGAKRRIIGEAPEDKPAHPLARSSVGKSVHHGRK